MQEWLLQLMSPVNVFVAVLICLLLEIIVAVLGLVPSFFITAVNVALFGVGHGFLLSFVGEALGAQVAFFLYRKGFKQPLQRKIQTKWVQRLFSHRKEINMAIILQGRLLPFIPSGVVTFYAAMSSIRALHFFIVSTIGKLPALVLEVMAVYGLLHTNPTVGLIVLAIISGLLLLRWIAKTSN